MDRLDLSRLPVVGYDNLDRTFEGFDVEPSAHFCVQRGMTPGPRAGAPWDSRRPSTSYATRRRRSSSCH